VSRAGSGFTRCTPSDHEVSRVMGKGFGVPEGYGPLGAVLWIASRELGGGGEVSRGEVSFFAVLLGVVGAGRVWENGVGYCRLRERSRGAG
jgi:hypothetical protein